MKNKGLIATLKDENKELRFEKRYLLSLKTQLEKMAATKNETIREQEEALKNAHALIFTLLTRFPESECTVKGKEWRENLGKMVACQRNPKTDDWILKTQIPAEAVEKEETVKTED